MMMRTGPRVVLVTRKTPLEELVEKRGTRGQARFYMQSRGQAIQQLEATHERFATAFQRVTAAIPPDMSRTRVLRDDLPRFLFSPDDVVIVVGQDGLVPNVAKYLQDDQPVVGVNPDPGSYDGVLCRHAADDVAAVLRWLERRNSGRFAIRPRWMAIAEREDGQQLRALNEVFVGHRTHQSARYRLTSSGREERQSSSGLICATGTGSTGWARSVALQHKAAPPLPRPDERALVWFVREAFPSVATGTSLTAGRLDERSNLTIASEMGEGGVVFADGIEADYLEFLNGQRITVRLDQHALQLVEPTEASRESATAVVASALDEMVARRSGRRAKRALGRR
jgi:NAD kinase